MKNQDNFNIIWTLTLSALNAEAFPVEMFPTAKNKWILLIELWDDCLEGGAGGIFEEAAHRIMWGVPCAHRRSNHDDIIELVMREMLTDGEAYAAWDTCEIFEDSVGYMSGEMDADLEGETYYRFSVQHYEYLANKLLWKVRFSKGAYAEEGTRYEKQIQAYETAIKTIVPAATNWTADYWIDENHILDEILKLYGVDYRCLDFEEYDRILLLIMNKCMSDTPDEITEAWYACNVQYLPYPLAEAIWPNFTQEHVLSIFLKAAEEADKQANDAESAALMRSHYIHPVGAFDYCSIFNSWIYPLIEKWNRDPEQFEPFIKEKLFTIATLS